MLAVALVVAAGLHGQERCRSDRPRPLRDGWATHRAAPIIWIAREALRRAGEREPGGPRGQAEARSSDSVGSLRTASPTPSCPRRKAEKPIPKIGRVKEGDEERRDAAQRRSGRRSIGRARWPVVS
jgi:hypothetical protein